MYIPPNKRSNSTYPDDNARFEDLSKPIPQCNDSLKKKK